MNGLNNHQRTIFLWIIYLIGITINVITEFLPLFLGKSIQVKEAGNTTAATLALNTILFYSVPIILLILLVVFRYMWVRVLNLAMSSFLFLLSIFVLYTDFNELNAKEPNYAPILMLTLMLVLSMVNLKIAFNWYKERKHIPD